jgi:hypothetical protein
MTPIETGCLCGAVRIRIDGEPVAGFYCHCPDCRAAHGAAYVGVAVYPSAAVELVAGEVAIFTLESLPRAFCPRCGTRLFARVPGTDLTGVVAARLPEGAFRPEYHIHCRHALAPVRDGLAHYRALPPAFGGDEAQVDW